MNISKLLRFLLRDWFAPGIVGGEGGGASEADDADDAGGEDAGADAGEGESAEDEQSEGAAGDGSEAADGAGEGEAEEVVVSIGDPDPTEEEEHRAPAWVRDLRKSNREKDRKLREQEAEIARLKGASQPAAVAVGDKPTLESCEFDTERYEREYEAWQTRKREADEAKRQKEQAEEQQRAQWQTRIDAVKAASADLKVKDADEATQAFEDTFSMVQQGIIIGGPDDAKDSALLRYALGKNPNKARELAAIKDPVKFAFAVAKLGTQLKVTPRRTAPPPDKPLRSSMSGAAAVDNQLARLQEEADRTGDRSKVAKYLRDKNRQMQAA